MEETLKKRSEVQVELTWDLNLIYKTDEDMLKDADRMNALADDIAEKYRGKLSSAENINKCLDEYREVLRLMGLVINYTSLAVEADYTDSKNAQMNSAISNAAAMVRSRLSFIESEINRQSEDELKLAVASSPENACYIKDILRAKPHRLQAETESVLEALSQTLDTPYTLYNQTKLADMQFPDFEADGKKYPLGYSLFEDNYEYEQNTSIRRAAFAAFSEKISQYQNTTAAEYNAEVQKEKTLADLRGYNNVYDYLLFEQKVSRELYDRQIDLITEKLAPHMRKYAGLVQKVNNLDKMTFADLKIAIDPEYDPKVTIEESKEYIQKGLGVLGTEYGDMIKSAYDNRWVDFAQNQGKCTGGFCSSPYGINSFILLSWHNRMADVFTLAHELGHAGHFKACNSKQSIFDVEVSTYFVEAPSTMNELLMAHYLLKTNTDKRFRRWVLTCMISNTYYHNFVTHLMEAAYQREVYKIVDAGGSVQADTLNNIMKTTLQKFWGDAVEINDGAQLTWMRQPHYYMGLYSYTYSAGLTIATQVCKRIEKEGQTAVDDWKKVLAAGSTLDPEGLAKLAGVDITTDAPLLDTIEYIGNIIDEICKLTDELAV